jgi:hypothetical protein
MPEDLNRASILSETVDSRLRENDSQKQNGSLHTESNHGLFSVLSVVNVLFVFLFFQVGLYLLSELQVEKRKQQHNKLR